MKGFSSGGVILLADADALSSGAKAAACGRLASLAAVSHKGLFVFLFFSFLFLELPYIFIEEKLRARPK